MQVGGAVFGRGTKPRDATPYTFVRLLFVIRPVWFTFLIAAAPLSAADWPQFRGPTRSGLTSEPSGWTGEGWPLRKLWQVDVGDGCTSPLLAAGKVYAMGWRFTGRTRDRKNPAGIDTVFCFEAATGEVLWKHEYPQLRYCRHHTYDETNYGGPNATPTFDAETGYLYTHGIDGDFRCLDTTQQGRIVWELNLYDRYGIPQNPEVYPRTHNNDYGCVSSPLIRGQQVMLEIGSPKHGVVAAYDRRTGKEVWFSELKTWAGQTPGPQLLTVEGVPCLATLTLEHLVVMRLDPGHEGKTLAMFPWKAGWDENLALPAIDGNRALLTGYHWINGGRDKGASALLEVTRNGIVQKWKNLPCSKATGGTVYRGFVYLGSDNLHCLEAATGRTVWTDPDITGDDFGCGASVILTGDDKLLYLSERNTLYLAEPGHRSQTYRRLAKVEGVLDPVKGQTWPHVALADGKLLVKDKSGNLACYAVGAGAVAAPSEQLGVPEVDGAGELTTPPALGSVASPRADQWPRFRGAGGSGLFAGRPPLGWDGSAGVNVKWKATLPLPGVSSPVAWGDRVFLTGANEETRAVYCYSLSTGKVLWQRTVTAPSGSPRQEETFEGLTYAGATPLTDGAGVFAMFGNGDLACFEPNGEPRWTTNLGLPETGYSYCTSLVDDGSLLLIDVPAGSDADPRGRLFALDKQTGRTRWFRSSDDHQVADSWATPLVISRPGGDLLVTRGGGWVIAREVATGRKLWEAPSETSDVSTSPVFAGGLILSAGYGGRTDALRLDGSLAWSSREGAPDVPSPVVVQGCVLLLDSSGLLTGLELTTGRKVLELDLSSLVEGLFYASPVAAGELVYVTTDEGQSLVLRVTRHGERWMVTPVARCKLDHAESCWASLAVVKDRVLLRSKTHLYCLGGDATVPVGRP